MTAPVLKFKRLPNGEGLPLPSRVTPGAAGFDLTAAHDLVTRPDQLGSVATGFAVEIPQGFVGLIRSRSGYAFQRHIFAFEGTIDADFRGELMVGLVGGIGLITRGDRIAQLVIAPVAALETIEVDELSPTKRGEGGFGSTGQ